MAIQALAGLPWLAGIIGSAFAALFAWFMTFITRRFALVAAGIAIIVGLTTSLYAALLGLVAALVVNMPTEMTAHVGLFIPSNLGYCVTVYVSAQLLRWTYDWNVRIIQLKLF
jgi:hypothetical protein